MFKFLFKQRKTGAPLPDKNQPPSSAKTNSSAFTEILFSLQSTALENDHYCHFADSQFLTDTKLSPDESDFIQSIQRLVESDDSLENEIPRLPDLLPKLLKMLRSNDVSWKSVVDVITQDSVLVAGLIRVANSPYYRLATEAENLEQVVVYLGQKGVREAVTSVALKPIMQLKGSKSLQNCARRIWDHSLKSAIASRAMADNFQVNGYDAYLAGLIHNVGMTVILKKLVTTPELNEIPCSHLFKEEIVSLSKQLSLKIVECWNMPQATIDAVNDQLDSSDHNKFSALGETLFYGKSISAHHTLLNEENWNDSQPELHNLSSHESLKPLFTELDQLEV